MYNNNKIRDKKGVLNTVTTTGEYNHANDFSDGRTN